MKCRKYDTQKLFTARILSCELNKSFESMLILCRCNRQCLVLLPLIFFILFSRVCVCMCVYAYVKLYTFDTQWLGILLRTCYIKRYHLCYQCISNRDVASCTYIFIFFIFPTQSYVFLSLSFSLFYNVEIFLLRWFDFTFADLNLQYLAKSIIFDSISASAFFVLHSVCTQQLRQSFHIYLVTVLADCALHLRGDVGLMQ